MPTNQSLRRKRYVISGHFHEESGYRVDRPTGCHDYLLVYTLRGSGRFGFSGGEYLTEPHDVVLISPNTPHRYEVSERTKRWELLWAHFLAPVHWRPWLKWPKLAKGVGQLSIASGDLRRRIVGRLQDVNRALVGYQVHREHLAINGLEGALLWCDEQNSFGRQLSLDPRISDVLDYICRSLDQPLTIPSLARRCHLSPSRFSHLFREQMQMPPQQFIEQQRIARAKQLLDHSGYSVAQIAAQLGFGDAFYFTRRFKKQIGQSPSQYRNAARLATRTVPGT